MYFSIDGVTIRRPDKFNVERYKITNLERNGAGDMCGDLLNKKMKFIFSYDALTAAELDIILNVLWEKNSIFYTLVYPYQGAQKQVTVYPGSIPTELHSGFLHSNNPNWVWKNVTFSLIER